MTFNSDLRCVTGPSTAKHKAQVINSIVPIAITINKKPILTSKMSKVASFNRFYQIFSLSNIKEFLSIFVKKSI